MVSTFSKPSHSLASAHLARLDPLEYLGFDARALPRGGLEKGPFVA